MTSPNPGPTILVEPCCADDHERRRRTCEHGLSGIDYVEVSGHGGSETLEVFFIGAVPANVGYRVTGGRRVTDLRLGSPTLRKSNAHGSDEFVQLPVGAKGDDSTYTLWLAVLDERGRPTNAIPDGIDPRYAAASFRFVGSGHASDDCRGCDDERCCPSEGGATDGAAPIELDYLAKDYASFRRLALDRLAITMPHWRDREVPDLAITLVEILAYVGDHLSYYQDAVATEAYLNTARQRVSVKRHLRLLDYHLHEGANARTWVVVEADMEREVQTLRFQTGAPVRSFAPVAGRVNPKSVRPERNRFELYTWGGSECHLPKGATAASLLWTPRPQPPAEQYPPPGTPPSLTYQQVQPQDHTYREHPPSDASTQGSPLAGDDPRQDPDGSGAHYSNEQPPPAPPLQPGDRLLLEEVISPRTGRAADADRTRRHVVRLETVDVIIDPVCDETILYITWCADDALPFDLCLEAPIPPACDLLGGLVIAYGNVVLVDHGIDHCEPLEPPVVVAPDHDCPPGCCPDPKPIELEPYQPVVDIEDLTMAGEAEDRCPSTGLLYHDPADAVASLEVTQLVDDEVFTWTTVADLSQSGPSDRHLVIEIGNDGRPRLRFGDGVHGMALLPERPTEVCCRIGNGVAGNVGADTIVEVWIGDKLVDIGVRNPLGATGGVEPEDVARARLLGPTSVRRKPARAVTPGDYAHLVMERFGSVVQRAVGSRRLDGLGTEIYVAIDPLGTQTLEPELQRDISEYLSDFRMMNHTVIVGEARPVAMHVLVEAEAEPWAVRRSVRAALSNALGSGYDSCGMAALFHPDRRTFGQPIYLSRVLSRLAQVEGVASISRLAIGRVRGPLYDYHIPKIGPAAADAPAIGLVDGDGGPGEHPAPPIVPPSITPNRIYAARLDFCANEVAILDNNPDDPASGRAEVFVTGGRS